MKDILIIIFFLNFYDTVESFQGSIFNEDGFIAFLDEKNYSDNRMLGVKVILSNNITYNNGEWVIIGINHDGVANTYDLWPANCIGTNRYDSGSQLYETSEVRSYILNFFSGFSEKITSRCKLINYNANTYQYSDYIVLPSLTNLNLYYSYSPSENNPYPYLSNNTNRSKNNHYWTRTYETELNRDIMYISQDGTGPYKEQVYRSYGVCPIIRIG